MDTHHAVYDKAQGVQVASVISQKALLDLHRAKDLFDKFITEADVWGQKHVSATIIDFHLVEKCRTLFRAYVKQFGASVKFEPANSESRHREYVGTVTVDRASRHAYLTAKSAINSRQTKSASQAEEGQADEIPWPLRIHLGIDPITTGATHVPWVGESEAARTKLQSLKGGSGTGSAATVTERTSDGKCRAEQTASKPGSRRGKKNPTSFETAWETILTAEHLLADLPGKVSGVPIDKDAAWEHSLQGKRTTALLEMSSKDMDLDTTDKTSEPGVVEPQAEPSSRYRLRITNTKEQSGAHTASNRLAAIYGAQNDAAAPSAAAAPRAQQLLPSHGSHTQNKDKSPLVETAQKRNGQSHWGCEDARAARVGAPAAVAGHDRVTTGAVPSAASAPNTHFTSAPSIHNHWDRSTPLVSAFEDDGDTWPTRDSRAGQQAHAPHGAQQDGDAEVQHEAAAGCLSLSALGHAFQSGPSFVPLSMELPNSVGFSGKLFSLTSAPFENEELEMLAEFLEMDNEAPPGTQCLPQAAAAAVADQEGGRAAPPLSRHLSQTAQQFHDLFVMLRGTSADFELLDKGEGGEEGGARTRTVPSGEDEDPPQSACMLSPAAMPSMACVKRVPTFKEAPAVPVLTAKWKRTYSHVYGSHDHSLDLAQVYSAKQGEPAVAASHAVSGSIAHISVARSRGHEGALSTGLTPPSSLAMSVPSVNLNVSPSVHAISRYVSGTMPVVDMKSTWKRSRYAE